MSKPAGFALPCMCASFRRASRVLTQHYDRALRPLGLRVTEFTLLEALSLAGEVSPPHWEKVQQGLRAWLGNKRVNVVLSMARISPSILAAWSESNPFFANPVISDSCGKLLNRGSVEMSSIEPVQQSSD